MRICVYVSGLVACVGASSQRLMLFLRNRESKAPSCVRLPGTETELDLSTAESRRYGRRSVDLRQYPERQLFVQSLDLSRSELVDGGLSLTSRRFPGLRRLRLAEVQGLDNGRFASLLSEFPCLEELDVVDTGFSDLSLLPVGLKKLRIGYSRRIDRLRAALPWSSASLARLTQLESLEWVTSWPDSSLHALSGNSNLRELRLLSSERLENFDGLSRLGRLEILDVDGAFNLQRIAGVGSLGALHSLRLFNCSHFLFEPATLQLDEIGNLSGNLHSLDLSAMTIVDSNFLDRLQNLTHLKIGNSIFTRPEEAVLDVSHFPKLETLSLEKTKISTLIVRDCPRLTSVVAEGVGNIVGLTEATVLTHLSISMAVLEKLRFQALPVSLRSLVLHGYCNATGNGSGNGSGSGSATDGLADHLANLETLSFTSDSHCRFTELRRHSRRQRLVVYTPKGHFVLHD